MKILREKRYVLIGAGNIGCILLERLLAVGVPRRNLAVCNADPERTHRVVEHFGVLPIELGSETTCPADAVLLAGPLDLSIGEIKALPPMETVDEVATARLFTEAARAAKEKVDQLQEKLEDV